MTYPLICTAMAPRTPALHPTSNVWPAPNPVRPGTRGWDAEQIKRLGEFCEYFNCYSVEGFAWLGYLNGETHARPTTSRIVHPTGRAA